MKIEITLLLPLAAFVAIGLFILKEILEFRRKVAERRRRLDAAKRLLAFETERNVYSRNRLADVCRDIKAHVEYANTYEFCVEFWKDGKAHYRRRERRTAALASGMPIPRVHRTEIDRWLPTVAEVSEDFYQKVMSVYASISEMEHVRSSLLYYLDPDDPNEREWLRAFVEYAVNEMERVEPVLLDFYQACTGSRKVPVRMR